MLLRGRTKKTCANNFEHERTEAKAGCMTIVNIFQALIQSVAVLKVIFSLFLGFMVCCSFSQESLPLNILLIKLIFFLLIANISPLWSNSYSQGMELLLFLFPGNFL